MIEECSQHFMTQGTGHASQDHGFPRNMGITMSQGKDHWVITFLHIRLGCWDLKSA